MDNEFKQNIKDLAQAQRLQNEEALHAENISQTIEYNEEIEEKEYQIKELQKKIKASWGIFFVGVLVLVIVLLYMSYVLQSREPKPTPTPVPVPTSVPTPTSAPTPEPVLTKQSAKGVVYHLTLPEITMDGVDTTTIGEVKAWVDQGFYGEKEFYYMDDFYLTGYQSFTMNPSTVLYELEDIQYKLSQLPRVYEKEILENPNEMFNSGVETWGPMMYLGCGTQTMDSNVVLYYNKEYLDYLGPDVLGKEDCIMGHQYIPFVIDVYDEAAIQGVEDAVKEVIDSYNYLLYEFNYSSTLPEDFRTKVCEAIIAAEPKVSIRDYGYSYYDDVAGENGCLIGIREGKEEPLTEKITLRITVDDVIYHLYGYLWHNGLY